MKTAMARFKSILKDVIRVPVELLLKLYLSRTARAGFHPEGVNRILVFAYHGLGNFIMYTPALTLLRERYPEARIDLQVGNNTGCEDVLAGAHIFDNIYNCPYVLGAAAWLRRLREIRRTGYDVTINEFHSHSWPLVLLVAFSGADIRVGHVTSPGWSRRFSRYSFVFNIRVVMKEDEHEVDRYLDLMEPLDVRRVNLSSARPVVHLNDSDREFARAFCRREGLESGVIIGVQPGTSPTMRWKQWPAERYRELIERLISSRPGCRVVLFGSAVEEAMTRTMARGLGPDVLVVAGKTSVKQVAALIEGCDLLVCNDSGLMHVAVAVGTPVVAIYGPTDIRRTAPLGSIHSVVRHDLPCSPCFKLEGDDQIHICSHHDCLMTITPGEVFLAVDESLSRISAAGVGRSRLAGLR
jgi:lipopolysaccharide heptosyltransferase II